MKTSSYPSTVSCLFGCLFFVIGLTSCSTTKKVGRKLDTSFEESEALRQSFSGLIVHNPETGEVIYEHNSDKYFTPASNTKLFTFYTGLKVLGDSVSALEYTIHNDSLIFWGTGDPTFLHEEFPDSEVLDFLILRNEELFYAAPNFEEEFFGPGWAWDDYNWYYSVERSAFPIYGNYVKFTFDPAQSAPEVVPSFFQDSIEYDPTSNGISSQAMRSLYSNRFVFQHSLGNRKREQIVPMRYSPELMVNLLQDTLNRPITILREVPDDLKPDQKIFSVPVDSIYKRMLQVSDNFIAEQILLMSAKKLSDTLKTEIAIDYMKENHLADLPDEPVWVDGSGLSVYNKFTPRSQVKLLEKIRNEVPQERLFRLLPVGGESGTIRNFYRGEEPYIFAKTGTLNNTHALSGFLRTKKGKILIFSFMNISYVVPTSKIQAEMENILKQIHLEF